MCPPRISGGLAVDYAYQPFRPQPESEKKEGLEPKLKNSVGRCSQLLHTCDEIAALPLCSAWTTLRRAGLDGWRNCPSFATCQPVKFSTTRWDTTFMRLTGPSTRVRKMSLSIGGGSFGRDSCASDTGISFRRFML